MHVVCFSTSNQCHPIYMNKWACVFTEQVEAMWQALLYAQPQLQTSPAAKEAFETMVRL